MLNGKGTQLTLPWVIDGVDKNLSLTDGVSDTKFRSIERFLSRATESTSESIIQPHVNSYAPGGRDTFYYRLSWRDGRRTKHLHIRGGNIYSQLAQTRAEQIRQMCDRGDELEKIIDTVKSF